MSWWIVAKKDFRDAARAKTLWFLTALFVLLVGGIAYGYANVLDTSGDLSSLGFIVFLQGSAGLFISIAALLIAYKAIAGERESGTVNFLLGLPVSRRDVVVGKLVGRSAVLAVALGLGFGVAAAILVAYDTSFDVVQYVLFTLVTVFFGVAFVSIAIGLSSLTASSSRAAAGAFGVWVLNQLWGTFALVALILVNGISLPDPPFPDWFHALSGLGPGAAYSNAARYFLPADATQQVGEEIGALPEWYGLVVLSIWILLPLAFGIWRFQRLDI